VEWQNHPVTEVLKEVLNERMDEAMGQIVDSSDAEFDRFLKGMIHAFREMAAWEPEFDYQEGEPEDEVSSGDAS